MEWHWGNIGSFLAGLSTVVIAAAALIRGPAALRDWQALKRAQAETARGEAENIRLERRRGPSGWSRTGVEVYGVALVTGGDELAQAARELAGGEPTAYVVVRVSEGGSGDVNRALNLRQLVEREGLLSRPPTAGELEALEVGLGQLGIPHAAYGRLGAAEQAPDGSAAG